MNTGLAPFRRIDNSILTRYFWPENSVLRRRVRPRSVPTDRLLLLLLPLLSDSLSLNDPASSFESPRKSFFSRLMLVSRKDLREPVSELRSNPAKFEKFSVKQNTLLPEFSVDVEPDLTNCPGSVDWTDGGSLLLVLLSSFLLTHDRQFSKVYLGNYEKHIRPFGF